MTDIVDRLRDLAAIDNCQASLEAADLIERLRAALEQIADTDPDDGTAWFHSVSRAALEEGMTSPDEREDCTGLEDSSTANPCGREDCEEGEGL